MDNAFSTIKKSATLAMAKENDKEFPLYYRYWGKARPDTDGKGAAYHLLPFHCLDVVL
jgi:CRISPR-associated endonuclease/helicase Cas3